VKLSILIPTVLERDARPLCAKLQAQIGDLPVEILVLTDNRKRSTGLKRQALVNASAGRFVTFIDDDDDVSDDYISTLLDVIDANPDAPDAQCISFDSEATLKGYEGCPENPYRVYTLISNENEQSRVENGRWVDIKRKPFHWCLWHCTLAHLASFPDGYIDDDAYWLRQMWPLVEREVHIDKVLHFYRYDRSKSLSNQGKPTT
jgi:hypothetical protein